MENNKHHVFLEFELPGFKRNEIDIKIEDEKITISAKANNEKEVLERNFESHKETSKDFFYTTNLPPIKRHEAEIEFYGGNLEITIPKK